MCVLIRAVTCRTVGHMESELDKLQARLSAALQHCDAVEAKCQQLHSELDAERKLRMAAVREHQSLQRVLEAELTDF